MAKIIIGIHGLANKPAKSTLENWWKQSIAEGLKINCEYNKEFNFKMVYWADVLYMHPQHTEAEYYFDHLYNKEPYVAAKPGSLKEHKDSFFDSLVTGALGLGGTALDKLGNIQVLRSLTDRLLEKVVRDLAFYYDKTQELTNSQGKKLPAHKVLQHILRDALRKHPNDEIMVISHSMGTIISYDTLRDMGQSDIPQDKAISIPRFVTIGSPLGITKVKEHIEVQRNYDKKNPLRTPTIVTSSWLNYADRKDLVAVDASLADDYKENKHGIRVQDDLISNDYISEAKDAHRNPHKSYGYLRTPELSNHVMEFLDG